MESLCLLISRHLRVKLRAVLPWAVLLLLGTGPVLPAPPKPATQKMILSERYPGLALLLHGGDIFRGLESTPLAALLEEISVPPGEELGSFLSRLIARDATRHMRIMQGNIATLAQQPRLAEFLNMQEIQLRTQVIDKSLALIILHLKKLPIEGENEMECVANLQINMEYRQQLFALRDAICETEQELTWALLQAEWHMGEYASCANSVTRSRSQTTGSSQKSECSSGSGLCRSISTTAVEFYKSSPKTPGKNDR